jgi:threonine dehydrogenase-like Zn-dependent dehydrogenase
MEFYKAVLHGKGDLRIEQESFVRPLAQDEVLVKTEVTALSTGTDLGNYLGDSTYVPGAPQYPRWIGYSNVGIVVDTGSAVQAVKTGDRVFSAKPHCSGFVAVERDLMIAVPESVSSEQASLIYLTNLGLAALQQANYRSGENIVVTGLGVIGLCTVALARAMGSKVIGVANSETRAQAAISVGAHAALLTGSPDLQTIVKNQFHGAEADIVVSTSNSWESYFESLDLARFGGRVAILGFPGRMQPVPERNPLGPRPLYEKQLTLIGAGYSPAVECPPQDLRFNRRRNLEYILDLMASGRIDIQPLITHQLPYQRMREAYELARQHSKELVSAVFDWRMQDRQ